MKHFQFVWVASATTSSLKLSLVIEALAVNFPDRQISLDKSDSDEIEVYMLCRDRHDAIDAFHQINKYVETSLGANE